MRDYKAEWLAEQQRDEKDSRAARARARREYDKRGIDRSGKDIAHVKALSKGGKGGYGKNAIDNTRLQSPSKNRSFDRNADGSMK